MEKFSLPSWTAKNPLGIIALFISLIYAMSVGLLGVSAKNLTEFSQTVLVFFVVLFPFVVLGVFAWLVANHHKKLYGPGDYRSDQGFLSAESDLPPAALGERLRHETDKAEDELDASRQKQASDVTEEKPAIPATNKTALHAPDSPDQYLLTYSIESLVFQEIQREFGRAVRRGVAIDRPSGNSLHLDGVIEDQKETILIEVKVIRAIGTLKILLNRELYKYKAILEETKQLSSVPVRFLFAIAYVGQSERSVPSRWIEDAKRQFGEDVLIRFYIGTELLHKYGLST